VSQSPSPNWFWCVKVGALIALVDALTTLVGRGLEPSSTTLEVIDAVDQIANVLLFSYVGYRVGRETGRATAGAEAGVVASLVPACFAAIYQVIYMAAPTGAADVDLSLTSRIVGAVALNIVLGGISALISGWIASRSRASVR
jgi:hypothetical protein